MISGWPDSFVAALETGAASWTAILDATRLTPDATAVTAKQLLRFVENLMAGVVDKAATGIPATRTSSSSPMPID
ncbi:hypothetical protein PGC08_10155 [Brevibacterium sp. BDJS002]|uniref:hypothetical protein n=1 Tax=Brevibacterium sp. BDJS002 TaxID=3020906 RepID=UPI002307278C|nr:hypothetical protein [Brevibacterium sp. BDJS002]WCE38402.1 hypothetical protein PGC08_10155 [Brevibacterium sp. BDJS002]